MDRQLHQIQHDASQQSLHQATQLNAEVALESNNNNKLVLKRDSIEFNSYQNLTLKQTTQQQTKAPTPITAQVETSPSLDDLDYYEPAPAIQRALSTSGGSGGGANTTSTTNAIAYCGQQHHVNTATSQSDYYSSPEAVESPLAAGSLTNGCSGGAQTRAGSWPSSSVLQTAAHQMASAAAAVTGSQSPQLIAQSGHLVALGPQPSQQHNQFQNQVNNQYASLQHHSQVQAHHHQHVQQQVSPAARSISPYQASYGTSPALANGYAPGPHHHQHPNQHHQHQLQQHHQPTHQPVSFPLPPPPQPMSLEAHQYGDAAQTMTSRLSQTKHNQHQLHNHHHHTVQHHQHASQHHHNLAQHHHQIQQNPYANMPPAHSNSHHQLSQHDHEQHYGNNHRELHYMNHHHHNHPHQAAHVSSPPSIAIGLPDQSPHEPIYPVQHIQQQHSIQHPTPSVYYQPKHHNHHHQNQHQQQHHPHHHHQNHYQQYQNSQQLFRSSTMLTPPRVEPILLRPSQMATPPRLESGSNLIRTNSITTSPRSDNNIDRSSSKKAESPLNQLHLQCANLLDEHQQQQQRISNILLKDGIDLSANNDNNISTTATTTTTPTNVAGANATSVVTATTSAKTSIASTASATSNGDSNPNNDNNISTTATTTTTGNSNNSANNSNGNNNNGGRSKRLRTSFKHNQLKEMKRYFATNQNPDANNLKTLAQTTGLSKRVLQVWFQNARAKHRRNTARLANQQLFNVVNQHTMLPRHHHQQDHLQTYQHRDTQHHQSIN